MEYCSTTPILSLASKTTSMKKKTTSYSTVAQRLCQHKAMEERAGGDD
jgi:hypothetical protein